MDPVTPPESYPQSISFADLIALEDEEFAAAAYRAMLGRAPRSGETEIVDELRRGARKPEILIRLHDSEEGRRYRARVAGLGLRTALERARKVPVLGAAVRLLADHFNRPGLTERILAHHRLVREGQAHIEKGLGETANRIREVADSLTRQQPSGAADQDAMRLHGRRVEVHLSRDRELLVKVQESLARLERNIVPLGKVEDSVANMVANMAAELSGLLDVRHQRLQGQMAELADRFDSRGVEPAYALTAVGCLPAGSLVIDCGFADGWVGRSLAQLGARVLTLDVRSAGPPERAAIILYAGDLQTAELDMFKAWLHPVCGKLVCALPHSPPEMNGWTVLDLRRFNGATLLTASFS